MRFLKLLRYDKRGFTLLELMVVIIIIGVLAALAVPKFLNATEDAKVSRAKGDIRTLESAAAIYSAEHDGEYPDDISDLSDYVKNVDEMESPWGTEYHIEEDGTVWTLDDDDNPIYSYTTP